MRWRSVAGALTFAAIAVFPALAAEKPYRMSSNNIDHEHCSLDHSSLDHSSQTDTPKTDADEADLLDDDLIGWLPLLAANDFLD